MAKRSISMAKRSRSMDKRRRSTDRRRRSTNVPRRDIDGRRRAGQRGVAALALTALLLFAMLLVVAATHRNAAVETQASAGQLRSSQAFEAAEAGLEWAAARLNDDTALDDDCRPSADAAARSFRDRLLSYDTTLPGFRPATWDDAGVPRAQQVACRRDGAGWTCNCPSGGVPMLAAAGTSATQPGFTVGFTAGARPGIVVVAATGCTQGGPACVDAATVAHEATAHVEVALGLVPGLRSAPVAALTVHGNVDVGAAALGVSNVDAASGGTAVDAGGVVHASAMRLVAPAGSSLAGALVASDARLAAVPADRVFARWLGMSASTWAAMPAVLHLDCAGDCSAEIAAAVAAGHRLVAVSGDVLLQGDLVFGSSDRPVVIAVDGTARLRGAVHITGLLYAASVDWQAAAAGAAIRGAVLTAGDYTGNAEGDIVRDADVLARLRAGTGSFVRVNGSWKDF